MVRCTSAGLAGTLRRVLLGVSVACCLSPPGRAAQLEDRPTEYEVKAAYLYNFVRFIEWPPDTLPEPGNPFVIAILGDDPFGAILDDAFHGKTLADRPAVIVRIHDPAEAEAAQIVFIASSESRELPRLVRELDRRGVLTVGDDSQMARQGTIIAFREEGNRIRFDINVERAGNAGLRLSSQLLRVATLVGDER